MDIAVTSMGISQAKLQNQAGILIMKKAMETATQQGSIAEQMTITAANSRSVQPHLGGNVDMFI